MFKKVYQFFITLVVTKILFWAKPELKIVVRNLVICALFIFLTIYLQSEFLKWSEISENKQYINLSFILKNLLILVSLVIVIFSIKKSKKKSDGFEKFRDRNLQTVVEKKLKPQESTNNSEIDDTYFDKFRSKKKLRTTQEIKLGKK